MTPTYAFIVQLAWIAAHAALGIFLYKQSKTDGKFNRVLDYGMIGLCGLIIGDAIGAMVLGIELADATLWSRVIMMCCFTLFLMLLRPVIQEVMVIVIGVELWGKGLPFLASCAAARTEMQEARKAGKL